MHPISKYILACEAEGVKREKAKRKEILDRQARCKHENKSRPEHIGYGDMSQYCLDCGKNFVYRDVD